ncbi:probable serine/threonine-protein kinase pats1 [Anneissia japonica]|uniref:probable serine/threonine-protein kinase pats1 n=1 Tax=Anneissia japonica TaxID=1529436 RepID=UPI0014256B3D|nr:probable serine/threonine-protein kinase pats1 [Anneissia japonica]
MVPTEILVRGTEAVEAFNDALAEGETEVNQGRTVFTGLERVGKTSTIKSFLRNTFDPYEGITDAIANTMVCTHESHNELNWKETSPDHSGANDMYEAIMADSMAKRILKKESEKNVEVTGQSESPSAKKERKYNQGQSSSNVDARNLKIESDTKEQTQAQSIEEVPETIATKVQERIKELKFTKGDATQELQKSGKDFIMSIWDFGGQPIYHVIQRIFMVSFAVVCVVFNLEDDLDAPAKVRDPTTGDIYEHRMTNLEFILYWIRSVYTNSRDSKLEDGQPSPPVLVIGTHLGSLEGNEEEKKRKAEEIFNKIRKALEGKPYESMVSSFFAIENSLPFARSNASNIMNQILKFAKQMVRKLPLKWLRVQQEIQKLKVKNIYLPTNEVIALLEQCRVKQGAQRVLLEYLHDLGEILYFPDDDALKDIIVLDLMKIVDMFKTIITIIEPKLRKPKHRKAWRRLDSGILEEHLLRHLWKEFNFSDKTFDFFVSLMQKFGLVCERKVH